ncbi:MAG: ferrous iron transport protein A [Phycisphaerales bacterium]|nr:ferrous iron transport protein A [Phycisphaerales bacterium]
MIKSYICISPICESAEPTDNCADGDKREFVGLSHSGHVGLDEVRGGATVAVRRIEDHPEAGRLAELGFEVGRRVRVARGGDPLICHVDGARIGLGRGLARCIRVEIISGTDRWTRAVG